MSPIAFARGEPTMVSEPRAGEDASSVLGMAAVGVDRSFDMLWVDLYRLNILNGPVSPRG